MTVSAQTPINRSTGNGVTTVFPYTFKIIADADIEVTVDDVVKTLNVDYTVSGAGVDAGGNVTMTVAPANATSVVRRRNMALVRSTDYQDQGELPATTLDNDIDATVLMVQQLDERLDRTFSLPASFSGDSTLPAPEPGYLIGWDATKKNLTNIPASVGSSLVDLAASSGSSLMGFIQSGTGSVVSTVQTELRRHLFAEQKGAIGDAATDCTTAVLNAIAELRGNAVTILDTIGGSNITAYSSGTLHFGRGIFVISADALNIYQDLGLTIKGQGSRRTNNSVRAATTLLISGTSSGYGIRAYRSGGRGLTFEDIDVCYETSGFTGSVLDVLDAPGVTATRAFFGTYGITGGTRLQTAAACVRSTYDEFLTFDKCVFDGAELGWWSDDTRTELANTFGGSLTKFDSCVFYDFADNHIYHGGTRTRTGLVITNTAFNPISVSPSSTCLNIDNVEGLELIGSGFAASVSSAPAVQWLRATNCTGVIHGNFIDDLAPAGQVGGILDISGNRFASTTGLTALSGTITGKANEFSAGTSGWVIAPTGDLSFDLGPDLFKAPVTNSYYISADSAFLSGRINYAANNDSSSARFTNASIRVSISNIDNKAFAVATTPYTLLSYDTGRTVLATGGSNQAFTLPTPVPGTTIKIAKISGVNLVVTCAGGTNYYGQNSSALTAATITGAAMGTLTLEAYGVVGWIVKSQVGTWVYS